MAEVPLSEQEIRANRAAWLESSLQRVVLLRETGPKNAAWHRARVRTIWRLHRLLEQQAAPHPLPREEPAPSEQ